MDRAQSADGGQGSEESYSFDDSYFEPPAAQLGDDWDTMMEEYFDEFDDFNDVNMPTPDDDF